MLNRLVIRRRGIAKVCSRDVFRLTKGYTVSMLIFKKNQKLALLAFGVFCLCVGFIGLFIPIIQGILFMVIGVYVLSLASTRFNAFLDRILERYPRAKHHYHRHKTRIDNFVKRRGRAEGDK